VGEAIPEVLDEGMAARYNVSRNRLLEATHRIHTLLEVLVVALQTVVQVL
jgi:ribose 1,5-bisphosphokinase PhnN